MTGDFIDNNGLDFKIVNLYLLKIMNNYLEK